MKCLSLYFRISVLAYWKGTCSVYFLSCFVEELEVL